MSDRLLFFLIFSPTVSRSIGGADLPFARRAAGADQERIRQVHARDAGDAARKRRNFRLGNSGFFLFFFLLTFCKMDMGGWGNPSDDPLVIEAANMLLRASYTATVCAAKITAAQPGGCPVCYLTLMGGGVFGNKPSWIADAIIGLREQIVESGVDFRLVLFSGGERELGGTAFGRLSDFARETGGAIKYA
jgi:hypothetical protein